MGDHPEAVGDGLRDGLPLRTGRGVHRGGARPAEPAEPAAHRVGVQMEDPGDRADAVPVTGRHGRVRAARPGTSTLRPRMTPGSAPRRAGIRMFPDMSLPACCHDRPFPGQVDRSADHASP